MKVSEQGEDYEEEEVIEKNPLPEDDEDDEETESNDDEDEENDDEDDDEDDDDEDDEDSENEIKTIFGIDRKFIVLGLVVVFIIIVATTVIRGMKYDDSSEEVADAMEYDEFEIPPEEVDYGEQSEPQPIQEVPQETHTVNDVVISDEVAQQLQAYGYTGDEIELAEQFGISPEALIESAKLRQINSVKEMVKQLSDTGSIAYQNLANMTYLGQEYVSAPVDQTKVDPEKAKFSESKETIQCTYEKCPTYGAQLLLKCKIFNGVYVWYTITPQRWVQLPQTGSITLEVTYTMYGDNIYVSDLAEVTDPNARVVQSDAADSILPFSDTEEGSIVQ